MVMKAAVLDNMFVCDTMGLTGGSPLLSSGLWIFGSP